MDVDGMCVERLKRECQMQSSRGKRTSHAQALDWLDEGVRTSISLTEEKQAMVTKGGRGEAAERTARDRTSYDVLTSQYLESERLQLIWNMRGGAKEVGGVKEGSRTHEA